MVDLTINCDATTGYKKQLLAAFMNSKTDLAGPVRFKVKNTLNWVRPKKIIFFIFNCVLLKKN